MNLLRSLVARLVIAMVVLATVVTRGWPGQESTPPPNLILVSIDTLRADHLSTYGYFRDTSPTLTEISKDGVRFAHAFVQSPWTLPSHASLLTGRYPCAHLARPNSAIPKAVPLLAERLHAAGYRTAGFVNAPYLNRKYGFARGFDVYDEQGGDLAVQPARALKWVEQGGRAPFFLFLHTFSVHGPYKAPPDLVRRYEPEEGAEGAPDPRIAFLRGIGIHSYLKLERYRSLDQLVAHYDAGIRHVDNQMKRFVSGLRDMQLYDNAVIIITSDHGESLFDHGMWVGHGLFLYDDEIRVPLIVKPARSRPARATVDTVVQSIDVVPTAMALLGLPIPKDIDGESLAGLIQSGPPIDHRQFAMGVSSNMGNMAYLRTQRWKYIGPAGFPLKRIMNFLKPDADSDLPTRIVITEQLFDLAEDPDEQENLVAADPELADEMRAQLRTLLDHCVQAATEELGEEVQLNESERERLKSLGYVH